MPYLLDSDWCIDVLAGKPEAVSLVDQLMGDGVAISVITYMKVYQGVERSPHPAHAEAQFELFLQPIRVIPITTHVGKRCARLRHYLRQHGKRVNSRALDLLNAAVALEHNLVLVTRNVEDYDDIPDLRLHQHG